jgi:hypothetical protein
VKTVDCRCDIYVLNFNYHCFAILSCYICVLFWRLPIRGGRQNRDFIKKQYIPRLNEEHMSLTEEYMDTWPGHEGGGQYIS